MPKYNSPFPVRLDPEIYQKAEEKAAKEGTSLHNVINDLLGDYVNNHTGNMGDGKKLQSAIKVASKYGITEKELLKYA